MSRRNQKEGIIKERCQLRGTFQPVKVSTLECPKCNYYIQHKDTNSVYCKRCGKEVFIPASFNETVENISYIEYCRWIFEKIDNYYIYEIESNFHYSILLVTSQEDLQDFIDKSPFANRTYKTKKRKVRDLKLFLQKCDGRIVITKKEWEAIR